MTDPPKRALWKPGSVTSDSLLVPAQSLALVPVTQDILWHSEQNEWSSHQQWHGPKLQMLWKFQTYSETPRHFLRTCVVLATLPIDVTRSYERNKARVVCVMQRCSWQWSWQKGVVVLRVKGGGGTCTAISSSRGKDPSEASDQRSRHTRIKQPHIAAMQCTDWCQ